MSSKLLEILGRGISVDISEVIRQWLINIEFAATDPHESLTKIFSLMGDMDSAAAEEHLRKYLSEYPSCVHGRLAAAAVCIRNNQLGRAIAELNLVYTKQPNNTIALYAMGYCCERMGREEQALEFYQDCLKFKSHLQLPRQRLAAIYFKNGQFERTVQEYETLRNEYPDDIATLVILGYLYIASGKYAKAGETFNAAILMHPDNFLSENDDIDRLMQEGMLQEALSELDGLADHEYNSVSTLVKRADILSMLGNADEAISQYQEAVRICPDLMDATIKLGAQYLRMDQEHLAASQFNKAVEMNDQIIDAYMGLASAAQLAGDASEAATVLSLASAILPNSILLFAEAATLQFKAGMEEKLMCKVPQDGLNNLIEAVIDAHRREMLLHPQSPDVSYRLALLLMSTGNISEAMQLFCSTLDINPMHYRAKGKLTLCLFESNQKDAAIKQLAEYSCPGRDTLSLHYQTALLYCDKVKFASSLINLENHLTGGLTLSNATVNISVVLQNLGLLDRAVVMWDNLADTVKEAIP